MHEQGRKPDQVKLSTRWNRWRLGLDQEPKKTLALSRGMRRRRARVKETLRHETTSASTAEPKATASRIAESQRTSAPSASSLAAVTEPTALSMSPKFEPQPRNKPRHTWPLQLPKTPSPLFAEWTSNRCKPTSGTKRILRRSREKAKPSEYSGCSPGNGLLHLKLFLPSCTINGHGSISP